MAAKRKISVVKVLRALLTLVCVTGCMLAISSAKRFQSRTALRGVALQVTNDRAVRFLNAASLRELLFTRRHIDPKKLTLGETDVHRLEGIVRSNPWVQEAQAYIDNGAVLHVMVTQRTPAVRVFETSGTSYYLDTALKQLPLSPDWAYDAPVVTGVPALRNDSAGAATKGRIVALVRTLAADTFWRSGVEEIAMDENGGFELVPVLGTHRVLLGDTSRLPEKLHTLFLFYKNVLNRLGWDRYTTLDLRYNGQVVASPSLPWKPPVDRALSNINWVKAIVGPEPKDERADPTAAAASVARPATVKPAALPAKAAAPARKSTPAKTGAARTIVAPAARLPQVKPRPAKPQSPKKAKPTTPAKPTPKKNRQVS